MKEVQILLHPVPTRAGETQKGTLQILSLLPEPDNFRRKGNQRYHRAPDSPGMSGRCPEKDAPAISFDDTYRQ